MITEKGKNYFTSNWSECDCHLQPPMYEALIRWTGEFPAVAIGVVDRDYHSGLVRTACVYKDDIPDETLAEMENKLEELLVEEYGKVYEWPLDKEFPTRIYRHADLEKYGYSDKNIEYCFFWRCIFLKQRW